MKKDNGFIKDERGIGDEIKSAMFQEALLAGSYFHFYFDVTAGGMIVEEFRARDGSYPIRESTGMAPPVPYDIWVDKWYELYKPIFDCQEEVNIFNCDYFIRSFERDERLLSIEVKQQNPRTGKTEYMNILVVLIKNPADEHIYACIIWRNITPFRQKILENKMNLENRHEELRRTVSREEQFRRTSLSGAILVYNINLSKNLIEDEFYEIIDGEESPIIESVGLEVPCNFDEFCKRWSESNVVERDREVFLQQYNRQYMLECYSRNECNLEMEFDTYTIKGKQITLRNTALLVKDTDSDNILAMINGKDVTKQRAEERRKQEALQSAYDAANRANAAKTDFLSRMSHDIRTPMNAIIGMTAIAITHLDDKERILDCLQKITVSSKHLLGLINEVLDMSKIESGKIDLQEEAFSLPETVETIVELVNPQLSAKHHDFDINVFDITHEDVIGDAQRLQQVLINLLSNSIKYTPQGGRISLSITEKTTNTPLIGCYEFVVRDNGIGMSPEFQKKLFKPFERSEDALVKKEQGTGLGLAIAKNIVQMMNGKIEVKSTPNEGSEFNVRVFLKLQETDGAIDYTKFTDLPVLVADDDEVACETICEMLSEMGIKSEWVLSGKEAVDCIVERHNRGDDFHTVILDWKMPGMDGMETAKAIRREIGDDIHIVILSAYDWSEIEQDAKAATINAFAGKPLFKSKLVYLFNSLLSGLNTRQSLNSVVELAESDFTGKKALLVEDNDINAEIAVELFSMVGLETERVENGKEAVEQMEKVADGYYDVIFMDIQMPIMNGYEAAKAIRDIDRDYTKAIPIIAMSANAFAQDVQNSLSVGMNEHIAKPVDFDKLKEVLEKWL